MPKRWKHSKMYKESKLREKAKQDKEPKDTEWAKDAEIVSGGLKGLLDRTEKNPENFHMECSRSIAKKLQSDNNDGITQLYNVCSVQTDEIYQVELDGEYKIGADTMAPYGDREGWEPVIIVGRPNSITCLGTCENGCCQNMPIHGVSWDKDVDLSYFGRAAKDPR